MPTETVLRLVDAYWTDFVIVSLQALTAAIMEENFALFADAAGYRNKKGEFVSKRYAVLRTFAGVGAIAFAVKAVPIVANFAFPLLEVQGVGAGLLLSIALIHVIVDDWVVNAVEYATIATGFFLVAAPYAAILIG